MGWNEATFKEHLAAKPLAKSPSYTPDWMTRHSAVGIWAAPGGTPGGHLRRSSSAVFARKPQNWPKTGGFDWQEHQRKLRRAEELAANLLDAQRQMRDESDREANKRMQEAEANAKRLEAEAAIRREEAAKHAEERKAQVQVQFEAKQEALRLEREEDARKLALGVSDGNDGYGYGSGRGGRGAGGGKSGGKGGGAGGAGGKGGNKGGGKGGNGSSGKGGNGSSGGGTDGGKGGGSRRGGGNGAGGDGYDGDKGGGGRRGSGSGDGGDGYNGNGHGGGRGPGRSGKSDGVGGRMGGGMGHDGSSGTGSGKHGRSSSGMMGGGSNGGGHYSDGDYMSGGHSGGGNGSAHNLYRMGDLPQRPSGRNGKDDEEEDDGLVDGVREIKIDWVKLTAALPCGRDPDSTARRDAMYKTWDVNGNGQLSFTEVDRAMRKLMGDIMPNFLASKTHAWSNSWKPVIMRAFTHAKDSNKSLKEKRKRNDDYVEADEFRLLLLCLRQYFELYIAFSRLDINQDHRLTYEEFINAIPHLAKWGVHVTESEAKAEFELIDLDHGGYIRFDEFIRWGLQKNLDLDDDDDFDDFEGGEHIPGGYRPDYGKEVTVTRQHLSTENTDKLL